MGTLTAPVAVRVLDLDAPLDDLDLSYACSREDYRSVLAVVRFADRPIGLATFPVQQRGYLSRAQITAGLDRQLGARLSGEWPVPERDGQGPESFSHRPELGDGVITGPFPSVSVVVPTSSNPGELEPCLRSILLCDYDDFEVVVVENRPRSSDTARMLVERFPDERRLRYVGEPRPSVSLARNTGLATAEGEVVAFTDDNVVVDPLWLRASVEALLSDEDVACVTGLSLPRELESETQLLFERIAPVGEPFRRKTYRLRRSRKDNPLLPYTAAAAGSGASIVMLTEVGRELGGFDPALGPATLARSGDRLDLLIRLVRSGHALSYEPRAIVWREHPPARRRLRRQVYLYGVGLGATVGKHVIAGPRRREVVRAIPAGLRHTLGREPRQNVGRSRSYPAHLRWLHRLGMLVGPLAYVISTVLVRARLLMSKRRSSQRPLRIVRRMMVGDETIKVVSFREAQSAKVRFAWRGISGRNVNSPSDLAAASGVATPRPARRKRGKLRISVVVPARNAEAWIESCLQAIRDNGPAEVILVDGGSTDRTVELARPWVDKVIDDGGAGVAAARMLGVVEASQPWIALVDADVVLPPNALCDLDQERRDRRLLGLQAGLRSVAADDYWSRSLADHHNHGRSKGWFGVCATLISRDVLLANPLDTHLRSGEDIDLRMRLTSARVPIGTSEAMIAEHRFGSGFAFARDQWKADGAGLGRMVRKHGRPALVSAMVPFVAAALGIARGIRDMMRPLPYFVGFAVGNYVGLWRGLLDRRVPAGGRRLLVASVLVWLIALPVLLVVAAAGLVVVSISIGQAAYNGHLLPATLALLAVAILFEIGSGAGGGRFATLARSLAPLSTWAITIGLILSGLRLVQVVGL